MLDPVTINEYSSPRTFDLHDVVSGSRVLVLHSFGGMFLGDAVSLVFLSTDYVNLRFALNGLTVSQPCDERAVRYEQEFGMRRKNEVVEGRRVFIIRSQEQEYVVVAAKMWVIVTAHDPRLSLRPLFADDVREREAFISQHIKDWSRMCALDR